MRKINKKALKEKKCWLGTPVLFLTSRVKDVQKSGFVIYDTVFTVAVFDLEFEKQYMTWRRNQAEKREYILKPVLKQELTH